MKYLILLACMCITIPLVSSAAPGSTYLMDTCVTGQGFDDYFQFLWAVIMKNDLLDFPTKKCLVPFIGESAKTSIEAIKAKIDFKTNNGFIEQNVAAYSASVISKKAGGQDLNKIGTVLLNNNIQKLTWPEYRDILNGMYYVYMACDLHWYKKGCKTRAEIAAEGFTWTDTFEK